MSAPAATPTPSPRRRPPAALTAAWWCLAAAVAQSPADLECKVVATAVPFAGAIRCEIEVHNRSGRVAEPTLFAARLGKDDRTPHRIERCPLPYAGRIGRGIPAGGSLRYQLQLADTESPKSLRVEVAAATFRDGAAAPPTPVTIGALRQGSVMLGNREVPATYVEMQNAGDLPVDVILLATFRAPHQGQSLLTARLPAGHAGEIDFERQPAALDWSGRAGGDEGVALERVEVVDWTTWDREALGGESPADALERAYGAWLRWDEPWPSGDGEFGARYARSNTGGGDDIAIQGKLRLKDVAPPMVDADGALALQPLQALDRAIDAAFGDLRRPAPAMFAREHKITLVDRDRFLLDGPGLPGMFGKLVDVEDGAVVGTADPDAPATNRQRWLLRRTGDRWTVTGRDTLQAELGEQPTQLERRVYTRLRDWVVPLWYRLETRHGAFRERIEVQVRLDDLVRRGPPAAAAVGGPDAPALAAAWDNGYRYPTQPTPLSGKFELRAGDDAAWLGQRRLKGDLSVPAFAGFCWDGRGLWPRTVGVERAGDDQAALAAAVGEHLLRWAALDFAGRAPFAAVFAGGTVLADPARSGVFGVGNCAVDEVEVQDGRVVRVHWRDGGERQLRWGKARDVAVVVEVRDGALIATADWKKLDNSWTLPSSIRIEHRCSPDPGADVLLLPRLALK